MIITQSKLMQQLCKEQQLIHQSSFNQQVIEQIYFMICKQQQKNLMLPEFIAFAIDKELVSFSQSLQYFDNLFQEILNNTLKQQIDERRPSLDEYEHRFSLKKFIKLLKQMAKTLFPGCCNAYQTMLFDRLMRNEGEEHRIKTDDGLRKLINHQTISAISEYDYELQGIFEAYMPQNYNKKLSFLWQEIKILEKRLPIVCFLRFLYQAEVVPQLVTPAQFLEVISKLRPPTLPTSGSTKEAMFYTSETITLYVRDQISLPLIRLIEGDIGLTFLQLQLLFIRIAGQFAKDLKNESAANIHKLASYIQLKEAFKEKVVSKNRFMETISNRCKLQINKSDKIIVKKCESKKNIQDLYDSKDLQLQDESMVNVYRNMRVETSQISLIKKNLDGELGELPPRKKVEKENEGYFDVNKRHVVIGEQLPKIIDKNKQFTKDKDKKKTDDLILGYKPEINKNVEESDVRKLVRRPKKLRTNAEFPIILSEVFYPSDLKSQLLINSKAELYLETSYIHLGQRFYEKAFLDYVHAKQCTKSKSSITQFYYSLHAAQIFESAGRDEIALTFYYHAKELAAIVVSVEGRAKSYPYVGMGACLYHMQEYKYALRCFQKAKAVYGENFAGQSQQSAILQNNIGCCLMMLNRNQEATKCFQIAHSILDLRIGCFDERTLVTQQNSNKNRKAFLDLMPDFKTMWKTYLQKSDTKLPVVKSVVKLKR